MSDYFDNRGRLNSIKERYEEQKQFRMGIADHSLTHGKEYQFFLRWSGNGEKVINYVLDYYNDKLYYLDYGYLFSANEDSSEQKVLLKIEDYFDTDTSAGLNFSNVFLSVNETGIYLYQHGKKTTVIRFSLDGSFVKKLDIKAEIFHVYIYKTRIYFASNVSKKQTVNYIDFEKGVKKTIFEASTILELYGDLDRVVIKALYSNVKKGVEASDDGWYIHIFETGETQCLSSKEYPPHRVWEYPDEYISGNLNALINRRKLMIRAVNLVENIMWVASYLKEKSADGIATQEYWEPMKLALYGESVQNFPIWRMTPGQFGTGNSSKNVSEASYFDGNCFLNGRGVYTMKLYQIDGSFESYGESKDRGSCNKFRVLHGYVYSNFDGRGWEQYKLEDEKMVFVRKCWFSSEEGILDDAADAILDYQQKNK